MSKLSYFGEGNDLAHIRRKKRKETKFTTETAVNYIIASIKWGSFFNDYQFFFYLFQTSALTCLCAAAQLYPKQEEEKKLNSLEKKISQ